MCLPGFIPIWETEFSRVRMFPDKHIPEFIHSPIRAGIVGTNPAPFLDWGGESRLVTSLSSPGPGWPGIGGMTEEYAKIGTALARGS